MNRCSKRKLSRALRPHVIVLLAVALTAQASALDLHDCIVVRADGVLVHIPVEIAQTQLARARGLMHRTELANRSGMLFDFESNRNVAMWMKNTLIRLDIVFFSESGLLEHISRNTEPHSLKRIFARSPVRYVLEINAGEASAYGLARGDKLLLPRALRSAD